MTTHGRFLVIVALVASTFALVPAGAIVGGQPTGASESPFVVSLQQRGSHRCGGSVVAPRWVLTAAHCVEGRGTAGLSVVVGRAHLGASGAGARIAVGRTVTHPVHDVALVQLVRATDVPAVSLAGPGDDRLERHGRRARVAGWGDRTPIVGGGLLPSARLRSAQVELVGDGSCGPSIARPAAELCAAALLTDACQGDSGGPLWVSTPRGPVQIGVVSRGVGCAVPLFPGVYAEVNNASIRSFVQAHL